MICSLSSKVHFKIHETCAGINVPLQCRCFGQYSNHQYRYIRTTVEPVLSGPVLSRHPPLGGQLSKSRKLLSLITVILTSIKRSPLLSSRGHPLLSPDELFLLS